MNREKAIEMIGEAMGKKSWHSQMGGGYPNYSIGPDRVLKLLFGGNEEETQKSLMRIAEKAERHLFNSMRKSKKEVYKGPK